MAEHVGTFLTSSEIDEAIFRLYLAQSQCLNTIFLDPFIKVLVLIL